MKKLLALSTILLLLAAVFPKARAADQPAAIAFNPMPITLISAGVISTNVNTTNGIRIDWPLYHTIHIYNTGTNNAKVTIERSLDSSGTTTNWQNLGTNTVNSGTVYETNFLGKYAWLNVRTYVTNSTISVLYLGGR